MKGPNGETIYLRCSSCGAILYTEEGMVTHIKNAHIMKDLKKYADGSNEGAGE